MKESIRMHPYHIPKSYYKPAMFAHKLMLDKHYGFNRSVDIAHHTFTADPSAEDYIPPSRLNRNVLAKHLIKYISNT